MTLQDVIDRARILLQDEDLTAARWDDDELIFWLNDAFREIIQIKPDVNVVNAILNLVEGTEQSIPDSAIYLIGVIRNMGTDGATPGRGVKNMERALFDSTLPNWHLDTPSSEVRYWIYNEMNPRKFWVYPPQPATNRGSVLIKTVDNIAEIVDPNDPLPIDDAYLNAILDYVMHRAYLKDAEIETNAALASAYYQSFQQRLGLQLQAKMGVVE